MIAIKSDFEWNSFSRVFWGGGAFMRRWAFISKFKNLRGRLFEVGVYQRKYGLQTPRGKTKRAATCKSKLSAYQLLYNDSTRIKGAVIICDQGWG